MRLNELTGTKHLADHDPEMVMISIRKNFERGLTKLRPLGAGSLGVALTDGKNVYKFWYRDTAYEKFIKFCRKTDSPFLPKFRSDIRVLPKFMRIDGELRDIKYIKMELLSPYEGEGGFELYSNPVIVARLKEDDEHGLNNFMAFETIFEWCGMGNTPREVLEELLTHHVDINDIDFSLIPYLEKMNRQVIEFVNVVFKIAEVIDWSVDRMDFGRRNMALRGDTPVILDPVVNDDDIFASEFLKLSDVRAWIKRWDAGEKLTSD